MTGEYDGSSEWEKHILLELKRLAEGQKEILQSQIEIKVALPQKADVIELERHKTDIAAQLSALKVKAGIWGALGASIPTAVWVLYEIMNRGQAACP